MFYHKCGGNIFVETKITIVSGFSLSPDGVNPVGRSKITINTDKKNQIIFVCNNCGENVSDFSTVFSSCMFCGESRPVTEMYYIRGSGGIYCKKHATEEFSDSQKICLVTILAKK